MIEEIEDGQEEELEVKETPASDEDEKKLAEYFLHQITIAKKQHEKFYDRGEKAVKEYLAAHSDSDQEKKAERRLNIFNSIINTMLPSFYARTPKVEVTLRKKVGGLLDVLGAQAIENGGQYCLEECQNFDDESIQAVKSFLTVGRGVFWERYEVKTEEVTEEVPLIPGQDGMFYYSDGAPYEGSPDEVEMTEDGFFSAQMTYEKVVSEKSITEFVHYKDYLQQAARLESEIDWKARRVYMSKAEFKKRFKEFDVNKLTFDTVPEELNELATGKDEAKRLHGKTAIWELHCKSKNKVLWLCEEYAEGPIEISEPPVKLKKFWPCSQPLVANQLQDSAVPVSDYHIIEDMLVEVEKLTTRMHACIEAIRVNAAYDKSMGSMLEDLMTDDFQMIPIDDFATFAEKGSLEQRIFYAPVEPYINALQVLAQSRNETLGKIYELTGSSDLIRGATNPSETAAAQQLKGNFAALRFSLRQRQVQEFLSEQIGIKCEVMCSQFSDETLYEICRGDELSQQIPPDPQTGEPVFDFGQVVEYIRNPYKYYKIAIETDSMIAMDEAQERQDRTDFLNSIGQFVSQILPSMQQYPALAPMFMEMVTFATRSYRAGKELETVIETQLGAFRQQMEQQQAQQQEQQQDPAMMEAQVKLQVAQIEAQSQQQKMQVEAQVAQHKMQAEMQKLQGDAQIKQMEMQLKLEQLKLEQEKIRLEYHKMGQDRQMKDLQLQEQAAKTATTIQKEAMDTEQELVKGLSKASTREGVEQVQAVATSGSKKETGAKMIKWVPGGAIVMPYEDNSGE